MNPSAASSAGRPLQWLLAVLLSIAIGLVGAYLARDRQERAHLELLRHDAQRLGVELMSLTLNGSLMGATELLGRIDQDIKREAQGELAPNGPAVTRLLRGVMRSGVSDGGFVVGRDGIIKSSFGLGKSSTGVNVQFRPYFQAAMTGKQNVYAAIGTTTGKRTLYFAAPAFEAEEPGSPIIGVVVARGGIEPVDALLAKRQDIALLLSPQGVVFAASRPEWVGFMAGQPSPERLKAIRNTKQFGAMFDNKEPPLLPVSVQAGLTASAGIRYAIAAEAIRWNDPLGDWQLVLIEDLAAAVPERETLMVGGGLMLAVLGLLAVLLNVFRNRQARLLASQQIEAYARRQQIEVERKSRQAEAARRLQQAQGSDEIARIFLAEAHGLLGAFQGVVYVVSETSGEHLRLAASYAGCEAVRPELAFGETLLGECALSGETQVIETPPDGIWSINSGLGHSRPAAVLFGPVKVHGELLGVVELAVVKLPDDDLRQIFNEMLELLALNLRLASQTRSRAPDALPGETQ